MLTNFIIGVAASAVVGLALWLLLPRGVVLTRNRMTQDWAGRPIYDTWALRNDSALPIRVRRVLVTSASLPDGPSGQFAPRPLTADLQKRTGASVQLDDEIAEITREEAQGGRWEGVRVEPGDSLIAHVPNNTGLTVHYRRAGVAGVLERRTVRVQGGV